MAASSFLGSQTGRFSRFIGRLGRSRFFVISVALHFVLVLTGGSVVLFRQASQPKDVTTDSDGPLVAQAAPVEAPAVQPLEQPTDPTITDTVSQPTASLTAITSVSNANTAFSLPASTIDVPVPSRSFVNQTVNQNAAASAVPRANEIPRQIATAMKKFQQGWTKSDEVGSGVNKSRTFKFTAYLARYQNGDWDSTVTMAGNKIDKGAFPNLLYIMRKWSRDKVDAQPNPEPLNLASDEIFSKKPPFILFTGHRDFTLTDQEVENLRKYLQLGGCIWGDSSLPGNRSRFDIAFRREMKRVLPDQDINWEALPPNHPIYTKTYYPEISAVPSGLNYYQEPIYALKNYGEISVLYTANDYGDMMRFALDEKGQFDLRMDEHDAFVAMDGTLWFHKDIFFRNSELKPVVDSYKFSTNIVLHLLTRWEDKLRLVPTGL